MTASYPIPSGDIAKYRTSGSHTVEGVSLAIIRKNVVATAEVVTAPALSPMVELVVTGFIGYESVIVGQLVKIHNVVDGIKAWCVITKLPLFNRVYMNPTTIGESLHPDPIELFVEAGDLIEIYDFCPMVGLFSTIRGGQFYKNWDVPHTDQNSSPPPVSNAGAWQLEIAVGGIANVTLPRNGYDTSFGLWTDVVSHEWSNTGGGIFTGGTLPSDPIVEMQFEPGTYRVDHTITDGRGKTHTSYAWVVVVDPVTYPDLSQYGVEIISDEQDVSGREIKIALHGETQDLFLPGCAIIMREWPEFDGELLSDNNTPNDVFVGYCTSNTFTRELENNSNKIEMTFSSPLRVASNIQQPPQALIETAEANKWTECNYTLSNPQGALYYAIKWHTPTLMNWHDLETNNLIYPRKKSYRYDTSSLADAMQVAADALAGGVIGCRSDGTIVLTLDPTMRRDEYRNSVPIIWAWTPRDVVGDVTYEDFKSSKLERATTAAFAFDGVNITAFAAIRRWGQGSGRSTLKDFTVTVAEGSLFVREVIGHYVAQRNTPLPSIQIAVNRNMDFADPADHFWHTLDLTEQDISLTGRFLVEKVSRSWSSTPNGWSKTVQLTFRKETRGQPGENLPKSSSAQTDSGWSPYMPSPFKLEIPSMPAVALMWDSGGHLLRSLDYASQSPRWEDITLQFGVGYTICHVDWDFGSPYFIYGRNTIDAVGAFVVACKGAEIKIFRVTDIRSPNVTMNKTDVFAMNDSTCITGAVIKSNRENSQWVTMAWKDRKGVFTTRSTDGGASWGVVGAVGFEATGGVLNQDSYRIDDYKVALDIYLDTEVIVGRTSAAPGSPLLVEYALWRFSLDDGFFTLILNSPETFFPSNVVKIIDYFSVFGCQPRIDFELSSDFNDQDAHNPEVDSFSGPNFFSNGDYLDVRWEEEDWLHLYLSDAGGAPTQFFTNIPYENSYITRIRFEWKTNHAWYFVYFITPVTDIWEGGDALAIGTGPTDLLDPGPYPTFAQGSVDYTPVAGDQQFVSWKGTDGGIDGVSYVALKNVITNGHVGEGILYRLDNWLFGDGDYVSVTPEGHSPRFATGLSYNLVTAVLETVGSIDGVNFKWYVSEDLGETWEEIGVTTARGVFSFDNIAVLMKEQTSTVVLEYGDVEDKSGNAAILLEDRTIKDMLTGLEL